MGYHDSSNLYAFAKNDPVNLSDPTGEVVPLLAAGAAYLGWTFLNTAIDVGIERLIMGDEFDVNASIGSNLLINAATGGLGKLKYLKHAPRLTKFGAQFGVDVGVTGLTSMWAYDRTASEAFGSAAAGHLIGRGIGYGVSRGVGHFRNNYHFDFSASLSSPNTFPSLSGVRLYRQGALKGVDEIYIADPRLVIDTDFVGRGMPNVNAAGWSRDAAAYWREIARRHPEAFDAENLDILAGRIPGVVAPKNNAAFRAVFKQYDVRGLRGKSLLVHHIGGGGQAFALPLPLHRGFGGVHNVEKTLGIWGGEDAVADLLDRLLRNSE